MNCWLNQPAHFTIKEHASDAAATISGPQVQKVEVIGPNIKVTWDTGHTSLAPAWWFIKQEEK